MQLADLSWCIARSGKVKSRASRSEVVRGAPRLDPCLHCVHSALAGKSTGECFSPASGNSRKCWTCFKHNHKCDTLPVAVRAFARAMVQARKKDAKSATSSNYTIAVRVAILHASEVETDCRASAPGDVSVGAPVSISEAQKTSLLATVAELEKQISELP